LFVNKTAYAVDFRDIFKAANVMYIFSTLDLYPDVLFPSVESSFLYLLYFVPYLGKIIGLLFMLNYFFLNKCVYLVMFLLLFAPIPVAVVYEGFRKHRLNILVGKKYFLLLFFF